MKQSIKQDSILFASLFKTKKKNGDLKHLLFSMSFNILLLKTNWKKLMLRDSFFSLFNIARKKDDLVVDIWEFAGW